MVKEKKVIFWDLDKNQNKRYYELNKFPLGWRRVSKKKVEDLKLKNKLTLQKKKLKFS